MKIIMHALRRELKHKCTLLNVEYTLYIYSLILEFRAFGFVYIILDVLRVFGSLSGLCLVLLRVLEWCTYQSKPTPWCRYPSSNIRVSAYVTWNITGGSNGPCRL
jgi:hypothetical protein